MSEGEKDIPSELSTEVVQSFEALVGPLTDAELEKKVNNAVQQILLRDPRLQDADIETIDALRDYVRIEAVFSKAFQTIMKGETESKTERMVRSAMIQKSQLREEIWGPVKDKKGRDRELDEINKTIIVDSKVVKAKADLNG